LSSQQQQAFDHLSVQLLAPCCWRESLKVHQSPEAERVRGEIASQLRAGKSESEVRDALIAQYGERILREPLGIRRAALYIAPVLALLAGLAALALFVRARSRPRAPVEVPATLPDIPDLD
jgi:cytochrome c-type biogenesis protein CcmH